MTTIANVNGKWIVVKQVNNPIGISAWVRVGPKFNTSYEARAYQLDIVMGRA